jgi:Domain of unknown function (DUF5753)
VGVSHERYLERQTESIIPEASRPAKGAAVTGSFVTLAFTAPDPGAVYLENAASALYLERPADVAWYAEAFRFVQAAALGPKETRDMLMAVADKLD